MSPAPTDTAFCSCCAPSVLCIHQRLAGIDNVESQEADDTKLSIASDASPTVFLADAPESYTSRDGWTEAENSLALGRNTAPFERADESARASGAAFFHHSYASPKANLTSTQAELQASVALDLLSADVTDHRMRPHKRKRQDARTDSPTIPCVEAFREELARCVQGFIGGSAEITVRIAKNGTQLNMDITC